MESHHGISRVGARRAAAASLILALALTLPGCGRIRQQQLEAAVSRGDSAGVADLLARGTDPNTRSSDQVPLLILAVQRGDGQVVLALAKAGARLEDFAPNGETALTTAVVGGKPELAALLLSQGAKMSARNRAGRTPLMQAASAGPSNAVETLCRAGVAVDDTDSLGMTALMLAAAAGKEQTVAVLRRAGADIGRKDGNGLNAAAHARRAGHSSLAEFLDSRFEDGTYKGKTSQGQVIRFEVRGQRLVGIFTVGYYLTRDVQEVYPPDSTVEVSVDGKNKTRPWISWKGTLDLSEGHLEMNVIESYSTYSLGGKSGFTGIPDFVGGGETWTVVNGRASGTDSASGTIEVFDRGFKKPIKATWKAARTVLGETVRDPVE